jgi:N-methylhydantoinase A/oxoprolinase/acetone carboxylase beta subunit
VSLMPESSTVDVDIGGTFTDCFVRLPDGRGVSVKTPTTGYRLAVGFMRALDMAAGEFGMSTRDLLAQTGIIRYSTTVALNTLLQRTGPQLALITTEGFEDLAPLVGRGASWMDASTVHEIRNVARITKPRPLVTPERIVGVRERIDAFGNVVRPLDEEHFKSELRRLVDYGARGFVVSLMFSYLNPVHERRIRDLISEEYPEAYLGSMPTMLSSDVCPKRWEYTRTNTTLINAYLHQAMWEELAGMSDDLRTQGYAKSIMLVHNTGGMSEVYRTSALTTFNSGPVAGLIGAASVGRQLGYDNVLVADMGGTSFDIGLIEHGSTRFYNFRPTIDRFWVDQTMLQTRSIGAGGGSTAWLNEAIANRLEVGPHSAGSMPGPAALGLGGKEPTVTDADIVLGYINTERYHGGDMRLDRNLAVEAIRTRIAEPSGISVEEAAASIRRIVDAKMADILARETYLRGVDPREFVVFAYGGAGPTHCSGFGSSLGVSKVIVFPFSPIFCAWGASTMPIVHIYEHSRRIELLQPTTMKLTDDYEAFNEIVEELERKAVRDLRGEGFATEAAIFTLELDMKYGGQIHVHRATSPRLRLTSPDDVRAVAEEFEREYAEFYSPILVYPEGGLEIHNFTLRATIPTELSPLPTYPEATAAAQPTAHRDVYWTALQAFTSTPIYDEGAMQPGHQLEGPCIVEADYTSLVVDPGVTLDVDEHRNLILTLPTREIA